MHDKLMIVGATLALALCACGAKETQEIEKPATTKDTEVTTPEAQKVAATYDLKIEGMMCTNCQATVTKLLSGMDGVAEAKVDWETGSAKVTMEPGRKFDDAAAHELIDKDYKLVESKPASVAK